MMDKVVKIGGAVIGSALVAAGGYFLGKEIKKKVTEKDEVKVTETNNDEITEEKKEN